MKKLKTKFSNHRRKNIGLGKCYINEMIYLKVKGFSTIKTGNSLYKADFILIVLGVYNAEC